MKATGLTIAVAFSFLAAPQFSASALAAGMAASAHFIVGAPDQQLADAVLQRAEQLRSDLAEQWFDGELPPTGGRVLIDIFLSDTEERATTWMDDKPSLKHNIVWITTTRRRATGSLLAHELTHVVLATRFPERLPVWVDEGIACLADDAERAAIRQRLLAGFARSGNWPRLARILQTSTMHAGDQSAYTVSASLTRFLLSRGDRKTLIQFAIDGSRQGWDAAVRRHYRLQGTAELQIAWQAWAARHAQTQSLAAIPR